MLNVNRVSGRPDSKAAEFVFEIPSPRGLVQTRQLTTVRLDSADYKLRLLL